jgi:hypothetical protein
MKHDKGFWGNWITDGWSIDKVTVSDKDRIVLRELAKQFRLLCERQTEQEKIRLWTAHNDLQPTRPLVLVDMENGWNEAILFNRDIVCAGEMAQDWEMWLRKEIMWGQSIRDDKPLTPVFYIPYRGKKTEWGIDEGHIGGEDINTAYRWEPTLAKYQDVDFEGLDLAKFIEDPVVVVDEATSQATFEIAKSVFDGILEVEIRTWWFWSSHLALAYSHLRGIDGMMVDFYDYPDKVHEIMQRFNDGYIKKLKYLESSGYLYNNVGNTFVGSGGLGYTNQLKPNPGQMKLADMWGLCEAHEATGISPDMYAEFIFPYHKKVSELFGLTCYGCCEPADPYWDHVKQLHNLRRVSVSQWAKMEKMSEFLGRDYIYSYKASSTDVSVPNMDEEHVRKSLRTMLERTQNNNVEIILKDLHTIGKKPHQVFRWVEIIREEIDRIYR